jgi:hypothetical protein
MLITMIKDRDILEAAILGYQAQISQIEGKIAAIKAQLTGAAPSASATLATPSGGGGGVPSPFKKARKKLSAKARKAIGLAQKKRWAELKKQQGNA